MLERLYPLGLLMTVVNDAVIVAAGLGSRMLPTSAYLPKESLPLVDVPAFLHLIKEAVRAEITRIHIITSPSKDFSTFLERVKKIIINSSQRSVKHFSPWMNQ